jgi:nitrogen PTS system EIIA component
MQLQQFLTFFDSDLFIEELTSQTQKDVFEEIAKLLEATKKIFKAAIIIDLLKKREQLGTTAIGNGIAIPHCRSMAAERLTVVMGLKSEEGINFDAPDQLPVKIVVVIIAPPQDVNYLPFLGKLVELLRDESARKRLLRVKSFKGFKKVITEFLTNE